MSHKYLVLAEIDGQLRMCSIRCNRSLKGLEKMCRGMLRKRFQPREITNLSITPWPTGGPELLVALTEKVA